VLWKKKKKYNLRKSFRTKTKYHRPHDTVKHNREKEPEGGKLLKRATTNQ